MRHQWRQRTPSKTSTRLLSRRATAATSRIAVAVAIGATSIRTELMRAAVPTLTVTDILADIVHRIMD